MIYLLHGDNYFETGLELSRLLLEIKKKNPEIEINTLHGDEAQNLNDIFSGSDAFSMFSTRNLLLIKRIFSNRKTSILAETADYLSDKKDLDVIFWEDRAADKRSKLYKLISKVGVVREFENRKLASLKVWLIDTARKMDLKISQFIADKIIFRVGTDEAVLYSEIQKISILHEGEKMYVVDDKDMEVLTESPESTIWEFIDALTERNYKKALYTLDNLVKERSDYVQVLGMIARQIRIIAQMVYAGGNSKKLGLHPFVASKIERHLGYFTKNKVKQMYARLTNLDSSVKLGKIEEKLGLTLYVLSV